VSDNSLIPISDEQAKAIQEALKVLQGLGSFLDKVLGDVPQNLVNYLGGDWLRVRRAARSHLSSRARPSSRGIRWLGTLGPELRWSGTTAAETSPRSIRSTRSRWRD
jgi:hypothetical protein